MAKKKIFDITPSQLKTKNEETEIVIVKPAKGIDFEWPEKNKIGPLLAWILIITASALSYFFIPHKASVDLWPKKNSMEETVDVLVGKIKRGDNFVQGNVLETEKVVSQNFIAQGKRIKSTKAQGIVRIYNNYSTASQILVSNTRLVSNDGKLFRIAERVTVPGGYYDGGKLVAGLIDIKVVADQPGEDYNINASTFSIPGFAGTPKYTAFYAKSSEPMSGGEKKEVSYATQEDIDNAKNILTKIAPKESDTALRDLISSGKYVLMEGTISTNVTDFKSPVEAGGETDNFSAQVKSTSRAIVFKDQDLTRFSKDYTRKKLLSGEKLIDSLFKVEYSLESVSLEKQELTLKVAISAQSHSAPEDIRVKEMVKSRSIKEIESALKEISSIEKAKVEFWPFWVNLAPNELAGIKVVLHLAP